VTDWPTFTVRFDPAFATGGWLPPPNVVLVDEEVEVVGPGEVLEVDELVEVVGPGEVLEVDELVEVVVGTPKVTALTTAE
jgi:hypothetical protein